MEPHLESSCGNRIEIIINFFWSTLCKHHVIRHRESKSSTVLQKSERARNKTVWANIKIIPKVRLFFFLWPFSLTLDADVILVQAIVLAAATRTITLSVPVTTSGAPLGSPSLSVCPYSWVLKVFFLSFSNKPETLVLRRSGVFF